MRQLSKKRSGVYLIRDNPGLVRRDRKWCNKVVLRVLQKMVAFLTQGRCVRCFYSLKWRERKVFVTGEIAIDIGCYDSLTSMRHVVLTVSPYFFYVHLYSCGICANNRGLLIYLINELETT